MRWETPQLKSNQPKRFHLDKKKKAEASAKLIAKYQSLFNSPIGRDVLKNLCETHYIKGTTFSSDTGVMALREGERNVVLRILSILKMDPEQFLTQPEEELSHVT